MVDELQMELYEAYRTRDRGRLIASIRKMLDLFQSIDLEKIREILQSIDVERIIELINLIGGLFGGTRSNATEATPELDLQACVVEAAAEHSNHDVSAQAIDIAAIVAIVRLIISIVGKLRGQNPQA